MKNKSVFSQIIILILLFVVCIIATVSCALLAGSQSTTILDFRNINFANAIPVMIIGGFISCVVLGITVLFIARSVFSKAKNYIDNNGGEKK